MYRVEVYGGVWKDLFSIYCMMFDVYLDLYFVKEWSKG